MRIILLFLSTSLLCLEPATGQELVIPANFSVLDSVSGDLDRDGLAELVVSYNTRKESSESEAVPRELVIYKLENKQWIIWKRSLQALLGSKDGGMMGDPYGEMTIANNVLSISHNGGSSWKWNNTDLYRYQDGNFYLIGYRSNYGRPSDYWIDVDFNLSTGKLVISKEFENDQQEVYKRQNETFLKKGIKLTLENRKSSIISITSPKYKHQFYLSYVD